MINCILVTIDYSDGSRSERIMPVEPTSVFTTSDFFCAKQRKQDYFEAAFGVETDEIEVSSMRDCDAFGWSPTWYIPGKLPNHVTMISISMFETKSDAVRHQQIGKDFERAQRQVNHAEQSLPW